MVFDDFLRSKRLYMLFVLPFLAMAIAFGEFYSSNALPSFRHIQGVITIGGMSGLSPLVMTVWGFVVIMCLAYLLFFINARYKFLSQQTTLPSVLYVLMISGLIVNLGFSYLLLSVLLIALALWGLQGAIIDSKSNSSIFDFGFCVSLAVLIYPKFILLILWAVCVLFFSGRSTLKDVTAVLIGMITPLLFVCFYYFWTDRFNELMPLFKESVLSGEYLRNISLYEMIRLGILSLLLLVSLGNILNSYSISVVNQRRGMLSLLSLLFFLCATLVTIPGIYYDFMYMLAFPLAYIYSQYFIVHRIRLIGDILFVLFLLSCVLPYLNLLE